jgi:predicted nucleotidyltransferase
MVGEREATSDLELTRRALAPLDQVALAIVFGSVARGTQQAGSDIDVAVLGASARVLELASLISSATGRDAHVVALESAPIPLLEAIVRDGIVVHESNLGAGAEWRSHTLAALEPDGPWYARQRDAWLAKVAEQGL